LARPVVSISRSVRGVALITTARLSANLNDFALIALLSLPGLRSSKPASGPGRPTPVRR
jgi:hypothetical protein